MTDFTRTNLIAEELAELEIGIVQSEEDSHVEYAILDKQIQTGAR